MSAPPGPARLQVAEASSQETEPEMESSTPPDVAISRARICLGAGLAAGALLIAGCGSSSTSRTAATMPTVAATTQPAQSTVATAEGNARIVSGSAGEVKATLRAGPTRRRSTRRGRSASRSQAPACRPRLLPSPTSTCSVARSLHVVLTIPSRVATFRMCFASLRRPSAIRSRSVPWSPRVERPSTSTIR